MASIFSLNLHISPAEQAGVSKQAISGMNE